MNKNLTEIAYILDRSGSMQPLVESAISGFNQFLADQREAPGHATLSLVLFDDEHLVPQNRVPIDNVPPLDTRTYIPRGSTALLDSIGITIDAIGRRLAKLPEEDRPGHVVIAIFTDGMENASRQFTLGDIEQKIRHQREKYGWEFLFLGANQDAIATAASMGIGADSAVTYHASASGQERSNKVLSDAILYSRRKLQEGESVHEKEVTLSQRYQAEEDNES
ncbi:vWA domain-containing protein [Roseibacillus persicicus]|uniref:VWFA domain-containing protein n=1 Tax=Roseibacillus persicicus TaxID=454148 RepID=A0A918WGQ7_9BACT|nr:VWA domain-containing protein [Roseibacillus persicicus]GHC49880.1 hypothetical protein GCM10007100_14790 [Roseibacillus persicicus]